MLLYTNKYCICIWWIKKSWAYGTGWWLIETANIQFRQSAYWHTNMWISGGWTVHLDLSLFKRFVCPGGPPVKKPPQKGNLKVESKVRWNSLQACWDVILILKYTSQQRSGTFPLCSSYHKSGCFSKHQILLLVSAAGCDQSAPLSHGSGSLRASSTAPGPAAAKGSSAPLQRRRARSLQGPEQLPARIQAEFGTGARYWVHLVCRYRWSLSWRLDQIWL